MTGLTEPLLSAREMSDLLGVSYQTSIRYARTGDIPGVKVGRQWRFSPTKGLEHLEAAAAAQDPWTLSPRAIAAQHHEAAKRSGWYDVR